MTTPPFPPLPPGIPAGKRLGRGIAPLRGVVYPYQDIILHSDTPFANLVTGATIGLFGLNLSDVDPRHGVPYLYSVKFGSAAGYLWNINNGDWSVATTESDAVDLLVDAINTARATYGAPAGHPEHCPFTAKRITKTLAGVARPAIRITREWPQCSGLLDWPILGTRNTAVGSTWAASLIKIDDVSWFPGTPEAELLAVNLGKLKAVAPKINWYDPQASDLVVPSGANTVVIG